jgi:phytoene dehydrogenase-like protein
MSGLAAGIRLSHFGKKVCILEKHFVPGGLNSYYRRGGHDLDVGLHAVTNFGARDKSAPLNRVMRQLRLRHEDFALCPQRGSDVRFPGATLRFSNDFALLESDVRAKFPSQADGFRRLVDSLPSYDSVDFSTPFVSARKALSEYISDPLLTDMLLCPLMYYGSAREDDMDFAQFAIMFRSVFMEGFARPREGVRRIIGALLKQYKECGGELRLNSGVRTLKVTGGGVSSAVLESGEEVSAATVLSSAGYVETMRLCSDVKAADDVQLAAKAGRMTFMESISFLDVPPETLGFDRTISFISNADRFRYRPADDLLDTSSAVVCCPNNFQYAAPLDDNLVRITNIASYEPWARMPDDEYKARKREWYNRSVAEAVKQVPDFRKHVTFVDTFTPRTITRFTGHVNGAVYGSPHKSGDGRTRLTNLFLCGTDQGFLGIVGAMLSGISIANRHCLSGAK